MALLDIGVVSDQSGVPPSTLRYYEEVGLIKAEGRRGLRRQYEPETLTRLAFIALGKLAGFSLDEIRGMVGEGGAPDLPRAALHARADTIDQQISRLTTLRDALRHVADCPAETHMACPKFRRILGFATQQQRRKSAR